MAFSATLGPACGSRGNRYALAALTRRAPSAISTATPIRTLRAGQSTPADYWGSLLDATNLTASPAVFPEAYTPEVGPPAYASLRSEGSKLAPTLRRACSTSRNGSAKKYSAPVEEKP